MQSSLLPHEGVLVRLGPSPIHGIGAFALVSILTGTICFAHDDAAIRWIDSDALQGAGLTPEERALYEDFAIRRGGQFGCPASFDLLTPGWYLNQPRPGEQPNMTATADFRLIAARDIAVGEELTLDYDALNGAS